MEWPHFSIKTLGVNFGNSILDNSNWDKFLEVWLSLKGKKIMVNQTLLSKRWCKSQIHTISKYIKNEIKKYIFPREWKKTRPPMHLHQPSVWRGAADILDIDTKLIFLKIKWIQRLLNPTNALWKDLMLYGLNLILNSNQSLALFRQKQFLRSFRNKNLQKQKKENFFIQLFNAWLNFTNNNFLTPCLKRKLLTNPYF